MVDAWYPGPMRLHGAGLLIITLCAACVGVAGLDGLTFDGGGGSAGDATMSGSGASTATSAGGGGSYPSQYADAAAADFGAGDLAAMRLAGDSVELSPGMTEGTFTSRVFDTGREVSVTEVAWVPARPYGKPLPAVAESGYPAGGVDLSEAVLWLDFDDLTGLGPGDLLKDRSGRTNGALVVGAGAGLAEGVYGFAYDDALDSHLEVATMPGGPFDFDESDFTWMYWVRTTQACPNVNPPSGNRVHLGIEETDDDDTHLWVGCSSSYGDCIGNTPGGRFAGNLRVVTNQERGFCGAKRINDGGWHHLAMVKSGHDPNATVRLYVDGELDAERVFDLPGEASFASEVPFYIGGFNGTTFESFGAFDEIVVADRAFSQAEVEAAFARHAMGLTVDLRLCDQPGCADNPPFAGGFVDPVDATAAPVRVDVPASGRGRYLQYRVTATSQPSPLRPRFDRVTLYVD